MAANTDKTKDELLKNRMVKDFTDSLFYHIKMTEKCFKMFGKHIEMKLDLPVSLDELAALTVIQASEGRIHQRDLAKLLLKDRANTGRLLDNLENDGYISRTVITKNGRPAKGITITEIGFDVINKSNDEIIPIFQKILDKVSIEEIECVKGILSKLRKIIEETIVIEI